MDYRQKITSFRHSGGRLREDIAGLDEACESNRGRILNSAAVRRLQQKTQVFPLETNAAVRSRLTHSLEVMQTGRYIARSILKTLKADGGDFGLEDMGEAFVTTVEMACLLHDVGNPPFGHFGEEAVNIWMKQHADALLHSVHPCEDHADLRADILADVSVYEGNAQAIRIVKTLQRLNLTLSQVAAILKYTRGAWQTKPAREDPLFQLRKKPGYYLSELDYVEALRDHLGQAEGHRFPLTYIMEAADDISYCIADLDDAVDKKLITIERLMRALQAKLKDRPIDPDGALAKWIERIEARVETGDFDYGVHFRAPLVNHLVEQATGCYLAHHEEIFEGAFKRSLVEGDDEFDRALDALKQIAREQVFTRREVETLELKGMAAIRGLLDCHKGLLEMSGGDFQKLMHGEFVPGRSVELRLVHRLPGKYKQAYLRHIQELPTDLDADAIPFWEWYYRVRLLLDHISGMTDTFAIEEYQTLYAIA